MRVLFGVALLAAGCSKRVAPVAEVRDAAPVVVVSATSTVDAAPPPPTYRASVASFKDGSLDECVDLTIVGEVPDAGKDGPAAEWIRSLKKNNKGLTEIRKGCAAQFADRTALGTCTLQQNDDAGVHGFLLNSYRYRFEDVGLNDSAVKQCLEELRGEWDAVSRTSPEWRAAKLEYSQRKLHKLSEQLGQDPQ